jgi:uncharacterized membrane protein YqaE (UPF0057 family)
LYLVALICPPLAILLCGKPVQAMLCLLMCCSYFPAALWAMLIVSNHKADKRTAAMATAQLGATQEQTAAIKQMVRLQQQAMLANVPAAPIPSLPAAPIAPKPPRKPIVTMAGIRTAASTAWASLVSAKGEAIRAYHNLPEWAQPITWGLAAGTPISIIMAIVIMLRR